MGPHISMSGVMPMRLPPLGLGWYDTALVYSLRFCYRLNFRIHIRRPFYSTILLEYPPQDGPDTIIIIEEYRFRDGLDIIILKENGCPNGLGTRILEENPFANAFGR